MIFEALFESVQRGELLLIDGGYCRWHLRRDGQLTIKEIISTRPGAGRQMLAILQAKGRSLQATHLLAKCPANLAANDWYLRRGFALTGQEEAKSGRKVNIYRFSLEE